MNFSYWERQFISDKANLVIIGGGISGLSSAYFVSKKFPSWKILVLEKYPISTAASTRNAGFSCFGSAGEIMDDLNQSEEASSVFETLKMRFNGLKLLKEILGENTINYKNSGGTELFDYQQGEEFESIFENLELLNAQIESVTKLKNTFSLGSVPKQLEGFKSAIFNQYEGKLNPGLMMKRWRTICKAQGVEIHYGATAKIERGNSIIRIQNHSIKADQIAICTNGLTSDLGLHIDVNPARNLILLTKPLPQIKLNSTYHHMKGYMYFRTIHNRILLGGGRHLFKSEENSKDFLINGKVREFLVSYLENHLGIKSDQIDQEWTGIMGVSDSKETLIKRLDEKMICGVKLGGMGVAIGSLVGKRISELL